MADPGTTPPPKAPEARPELAPEARPEPALAPPPVPVPAAASASLYLWMAFGLSGIALVGMLVLIFVPSSEKVNETALSMVASIVAYWMGRLGR